MAQSYSFKSHDIYQQNFEVHPDGEGLYCLFPVSPKKAPVTIFRKVFLNPDLSPVDSVEYSIEGQATLLASGGDEKFVFHAFYSKSKPLETISFIVTDNTGRMVSTFSKTLSDFAPLFSKSVKKLKQISLSFLANTGNPGMMLIRPYLIKGGVRYAGKIFSMSSDDGAVQWTSNTLPLSRTQVTDNLIVGLTASVSGYSSMPLYQIQFIDKSNGAPIKSVPFSTNGKKYRSISVFTTNGHELMIAGSEYESVNSKNGKFYMSMYSLNGEKIFDRVDSAERFSTRRMHLMGNVFDRDGNLVIVAEGWKPDATRAIATTAGSVALAVLSRGAYTRVYTAGIDHKVDNVIFATMSPVDGQLTNFKSFPVGPWLEFGRLLTEGSHAVIAVSKQVISYDANEPNAPPSLLTALHNNENLMLTPFGPILTRWTGSRITLNRLR